MTIPMIVHKQPSRDDLKLSVILAAKKGGGKTTTAATFPDPFFFDFDGGLNSLPASKEVNSLYNPPYEQMLEVVMAITKIGPDGATTLRVINEEGHQEDTPVKIGTLVFDSITKGHRRFLESAMAIGKRSQPIIQDWGLASTRMIDLVDIAKRYVHVVACAHFEIIKDANTERVMAQIYMPGQLVQLLPICFDEFWHLRPEMSSGGKRKLTLCTVDDGIYPGSTRLYTRGMPPFVDVTDEPQVFNKLMSLIK